MFYSLVLSSVAGLSTIIGSTFIFIKTKNINKFIVFCLALLLSIMINLSIFDLMKESLSYLLVNISLMRILLIIVIFIVGILLVNIIDKKLSINNNKLYKLGILNMITLILHNIPEGIITFICSIHNPQLGIKLSLAILMHNIPEGISIAVPFIMPQKVK